MSKENMQRDGGPHPDGGSGRFGGKNDTTGITKPMTPARDMRDKAPIRGANGQWGRGLDQQYEKLP